MIMKTTTALFILTLAMSVMARPNAVQYESEEYTDNNLIESLPEDHEIYDFEKDERVEYVEISSAPKKDIYYPAEPIEAECRVSGTPVPTVEWVHGTGLISNEDFETNTIMEKSPSGIATVVARLIVKPHHIPASGTKRTYTCVGKSGGKIVKASTTVHFNHHAGSQPHLGAGDMVKALTGSEKVKIYEYYENLFDYIGSSVFLPCKATQKAEIYWINEDGKVISGQEPRFKVLATGDLLITNLQFKDMGSYICLAKNGKSKDVITTFIYPLAHKK